MYYDRAYALVYAFIFDCKRIEIIKTSRYAKLMKQYLVLWSCGVRAQKAVNITKEVLQFVLVNTQYIVVSVGWHDVMISMVRLNSLRRGCLIRP